MSYNHRTEGNEQFDAFVRALQLQGIKPEVEELEKVVDIGGPFGDDGHLRKATFRLYGHKTAMVLEEYISVEDHDCDGISRIAIEVYLEGERPDLESRVQTIED